MKKGPKSRSVSLANDGAANLPEGGRDGGRITTARGKRSAPSQELPTKTRDSSFVQYINEAGGDVGKIMARLRVEKARAGDTDAAYRILQDFVGAIDQYDERTWSGLRSAPMHWEYVQYIAVAFEKIIRAAMRSARWDGVKWDDEDVKTGEAQADANLALGIKSSKAGRRKGIKTHDDEALAAAYNLLLLNGISAKHAKAQIAGHIGADSRTVEKANRQYVTYRTYLVAAKHPETSDEDRIFAAEIIKVGAKPYSEHVAAILAQAKR